MLGTKIKNLNTLKEAGLPVPSFSVYQFSDIVDQTTFKVPELSAATDLEKLSQELQQQVQWHFKPLTLDFPAGKYAVRSSANLEDSAEASFAGQFSTLLNVSEKDLIGKIRQCVIDAYKINVLSYIRDQKLSLSALQMNVMVQTMVPAEVSGILFTANPKGLLNEAVIVAGKGLGEKIVSDQAVTTTYYYQLDDALYYAEGAELLTAAQIDELIMTMGKITSLLGAYLDIEFSYAQEKLFILQARKITTLAIRQPLVFDNSNLVESYPGVTLPLTISFVEMIYSGIFASLCQRILGKENEVAQLQEVFGEMVGNVNGRLYYKISNWYALIKYLPLQKKIIPMWQEMLGVKNRQSFAGEQPHPWGQKMRIYRNILSELHQVPKNMAALSDRFARVNEMFYQKFSPQLPAEQILELYQTIKKDLLAAWDVTLLNDLYAFIYTDLVKKRVKKKYPDQPELANQYLAGISDLESMKPVLALLDLALEKDQLTEAEYHQQFQDYIRFYGDRNVEELKLENPTFRSQPELLSRQIDAYRKDRTKLARTRLELQKKKPDFQQEDRLTRYSLHKAMAGIRRREISRLDRSRVFGMVRAMFLALGNKFCQQGLIETTQDIFYLTEAEVFQLIDQPVKMQQQVGIQKERYAVFEQLPNYSRLVFAGEAFDKRPTHLKSKVNFAQKERLSGTPCASGHVQGEVLVVQDVNKVHQADNKILVTKMTDPGWVFLLTTSLGIISEQGSLLSHTAIISRELHIPSIVGVDHVMEQLHSGDWIEMDGDSGQIRIIKKGAESK